MSVDEFPGNHMALAFLWCYMSELQNLLLQNLIVFCTPKRFDLVLIVQKRQNYSELSLVTRVS